MSRILKPAVFLIAAIYFLVDAVFMPVARPLARWLADRRIFGSLRAWIVSLRPYPTLALFMVPVLVLEPVKPVAAYLTATGHIVIGLAVLLAGEMMKLVLIERLFSLSRDKLMSIPAFAWCHGKWRQAWDWVESLKAWQLARRLSLLARHAILRTVLAAKAAPKPQRLSQRLSWQPR